MATEIHWLYIPKSIRIQGNATATKFRNISSASSFQKRFLLLQYRRLLFHIFFTSSAPFFIIFVQFSPPDLRFLLVGYVLFCFFSSEILIYHFILLSSLSVGTTPATECHIGRMGGGGGGGGSTRCHDDRHHQQQQQRLCGGGSIPTDETSIGKEFIKKKKRKKSNELFFFVTGGFISPHFYIFCFSRSPSARPVRPLSSFHPRSRRGTR